MQHLKNFSQLRYYNHIPPQPTNLAKHASNGDNIVLDEDIVLLERLSLVDFGNKQGVERLTEAILFASSIKGVNTDGVEPLYTVQEDRLVTTYLPTSLKVPNSGTGARSRFRIKKSMMMFMNIFL